MSDEHREKLVYDYTMESLLRVLGQPLLPEHIAGLAALGVHPRQLEPAYPVAVYSRVLEFITGQLWPELPREEASFALGRAFMAAYRQTLMGKAVFAMTRVIGPHRSLERMSRNFRSANNYTETRLHPVGPSRYELWFNHAPNTGFFRGLLTEALEKTGGTQELSVTLMSREEGGEATFLVTWSAD
ncbi:DUF2378 family protein [Melittangium boletus]|uniref:DUF2378 family protein n=1 Tax=Melittangium boletus DSM 14713 TaxID=1294270 RepID=A0A250IMX9_9BACT|nr:DUF2378 family protein [Melittangium boletus]ATB32286.1 hypothetical protein MEBOL_005763 [Melittangium boletus DSM 14713]